MDFVVMCTGISDEAGFWDAYLNAVVPDGEADFGRNFDAFRDAILGGGPGWPGVCVLRLRGFDDLRAVSGGNFCRWMEALAAESLYVTFKFE